MTHFKQLAMVVRAFALLMVAVSPAWGVQSHGGAEGLVSHQIGHILFVIGMGYLLVHLYRLHVKGVGWTEFKVFLWLIIAWNILTFSGHWMHEVVDKERFIITNEHVTSFSVSNFTDAYYYVTNLDHVVLVPALAFLLCALREWRAQ